MQLTANDLMTVCDEGITKQTRRRQRALATRADEQYPPAGSVMPTMPPIIHWIHLRPHGGRLPDGILVANPCAQLTTVALLLVDHIAPIRYKNGRTTQHADA